MTDVPDRDAVLSAFLDNEPFEAAELAAVLADAGGRETLLDLIALRQLAHADALGVATMPLERPARSWRRSAAVVVLPLALAAGYGVGRLTGSPVPPPAASDSAAPPATRDIAVSWTDSPGGQ
jgi:hypothetical protein